eukprot:3200110-Prymnesium_polylepis.1
MFDRAHTCPHLPTVGHRTPARDGGAPRPAPRRLPLLPKPNPGRHAVAWQSTPPPTPRCVAWTPPRAVASVRSR